MTTPQAGAPRKVVLKFEVSVDGYVGRLDGDVTWAYPHFDDEFTAHEVALLRRAGTHVMGRTLYDDMAATWPTSDAPFAAPMNETPKVVFSRTLQEAKWGPTRISRGDLGEEFARLRAEPGDGDILVHGGASLARALSRAGLIDEYRLHVHPVILGDGLRPFEVPVDLRLLETRSFPAGAVALAYARA